jgi:hypothetical protein
VTDAGVVATAGVRGEVWGVGVRALLGLQATLPAIKTTAANIRLALATATRYSGTIHLALRGPQICGLNGEDMDAEGGDLLSVADLVDDCVGRQNVRRTREHLAELRTGEPSVSEPWGAVFGFKIGVGGPRADCKPGSYFANSDRPFRIPDDI